MEVMRLCVLGLAVAVLAVPTYAGVSRIDVSPAVIVNLGNGHAGSTMGGAVTGDFFFSRIFAVRTTVGFTKDRYYPSEQDYSDADYGFWLSIAPYSEMNVADAWRPYVAFLWSFASGSQSPYNTVRPIGMETAPVARMSAAPTRANAYSFGATLGNKVHLTGPVSLYAEVTHFFYTSFATSSRVLHSGIPDVAFNYHWDRNPTYLSLGLSYSIELGTR